MAHLVPDRVDSPAASAIESLSDLSADFVSEARRRMAMVAWIGTGGYALYIVLGPMLVGHAAGYNPTLFYGFNLAGLAVCGTGAVLATRSPIGDARLLHVALVLEVLLCALLSLELPWIHYLRTGAIPTVTWVSVVIVISAVLVPVPARITARAAIASAVTVPAGLAVFHLFGPAPLNFTDFLLAIVPVTIAAVMAVFASGVFYGAARDAEAARRVGSYRLESMIGEGGMGEVWRARHALLAREAAVKLIRKSMLDGAFAEDRRVVLGRFEVEAQATAMLRSPHTVELYDFGRTDEGSFYFAMELLEGDNLEKFVYFRGPVPAPRVVYWLDQVLRSLAEAHGVGLVHRDIKPANIFVCTQGGEHDTIKVLDFGIARPLGPVDSRLTGPSVVMGTSGFMAPEQAAGATPHPAMDLYAVGGLAYWLLAGHKVFEADTAEELRAMHASEPPPPLSGILPDIPPELDRLVLACLEKDPARRPADAATLRRALAASVPGVPWDREQAAEWWGGPGRERFGKAAAPAAGTGESG